MRKQKEADEKLGEDNRRFTEAQSLKVSGALSYNRFLLYKESKSTENNPIDYLNKAIEDTEKGLGIMLKMDGKLEKNELLDCILKNNFAWLYLEKWNFLKKIKEDSVIKGEELKNCRNAERRMLEYVNHIYDRSMKYKDHEKRWLDTYSEVIKKFPNK